MNDSILLSLSLVIGHAVSWGLENITLVRESFSRLKPSYKLAVVVGLCLVSGLVASFLKADLAESILVFTFSLLGSQVSHLRRK